MTYQICLQSIIQCVEYKICRARLSKTKEYLCDFVNVYHPPTPPPPPLSTTDIRLTTTLISEEQTILVQIQRDGHLGFWGKNFCTHLIFCNISISFQTNSCWHQKMTVCNRLSDACTNLGVFREESTNLSQAHA